jgi:hypothetical protein
MGQEFQIKSEIRGEAVCFQNLFDHCEDPVYDCMSKVPLSSI